MALRENDTGGLEVVVIRRVSSARIMLGSTTDKGCG